MYNYHYIYTRISNVNFFFIENKEEQNVFLIVSGSPKDFCKDEPKNKLCQQYRTGCVCSSVKV